MKYIIDEGELQDIKKEAERSGFRQAEGLLERVLRGERNLQICVGHDDYMGIKRPIYEQLPKESPWCVLVGILNESKR